MTWPHNLGLLLEDEIEAVYTSRNEALNIAKIACLQDEFEPTQNLDLL